MTLSQSNCIICHKACVEDIAEYGTLCRVTSDCKPWHRGGLLQICLNCGAVQKPITKVWLQEAQKVYEQYCIYENANGVEPKVFESETRAPATSRSLRLINRLKTRINIPEKGRLLDVGCGNGQFLYQFGSLYPHWTMAGHDMNVEYRAEVLKIQNMEAFFSDTIESIPGKFELIVLMHVLEHIPDPRRFLTALRRKLKPNGHMIIIVPDYQRNPFDLVVADHCIHFSECVLRNILDITGFTSICSESAQWMKENVLIATLKPGNNMNGSITISDGSSIDKLRSVLKWLLGLRAEAESISYKQRFGLFGTAVAASWLFGELNRCVHFFVDEDPHRAGGYFLGKPVYNPSDVPKKSHIMLPFSPVVASGIQERLNKISKDCVYHVPEAMKMH